MKFSCIPLGLVLAATLASSSSHAAAAGEALRPLSETEMSAVYGRGLTEPTLSALGALTAQEQSGSAVTATDGLAALGALSGDGVQDFDRQMAQQRLGTNVSIQANLKIAQTLVALNGALAPIGAGLSLTMLPFPFLFALPSLDAIQKKH